MKNSLYYRIISIVLVMVLVVSFIPIGTFAANTPTTGSCGENVTYFFNNSNGTLTISGTGDMKDYSMYDESPFEGNEAIKQVNIASGITKIGSYSFWCSGLTNIVIPNTVVKIGQSAFDGCRSLESINIPNSVNYIGKEAFSSTGLKRIELPNGISSIQRYLCDMCTSLTEVIIPSSVTSIGYAAFAECTSLESIDIPDSVTYIADQVFDGCTGLKTVTIPESVVSIGYGAFWNCSNLSNITIRNYNCEISDSSDTISSTAKICSHANSTAKAYADKYSRSFSSTLCDEYYVEVERVEPGFNKAGYEKRTCTVCGHSEKEDLIYYKTDENATRFASQEYILPVAKSCVYNNTLYARFDKPIAAFSGKFSSQYFRFGELTDNGTFQTYKALVLGAPRAWYILGGTRSGSNWVHQYSGGTIDSSLLHWASGEPNNDGGSENQISIDKNGYLNDSSATYNTTSMGFIIGTNLDSLKPTKENNFGTNKYAYYNTVYPFSYAQAFCEAKGGYLASISSDAENNFVFDLVDNKKEVFIGGIRNAQGNFEWVNGESFTYQKWSSGEPNNGGGKGQYYTHLYLDKGWDDINDLNDSKSAAVKNGFICEYEPSRIYAKLAQDNVHGITDEEVRIFAEYPDKTTADITAACDIDYHYNKGNVVVHATATKPNGEEIEVTNSLAVNKGNHRFEEGETTPATCTQVGQSTVICSICGKVVATSIPATGHKFSEETVAATCTQSGYKKLTCSVCGYEENTAFEALGHSYGAAQIIAPTATKRGYSAISCKRCGETYYDNYTLPACEDLPLVGLNAKKEISLSAEDEFAAVRFHSDKTAAQYILKKSANCGATPIKVLDENYRELARSNENCFCFSFEAGKDYILMSDYEANRAASGSISLVVIENSTQMAQGDLVLNMNIETNTLRISGSGNISDLAAAALYCDLVNTVVIDAAIDSVQTQAFAQFAHLSAIQFKGSNTEIVGVAAALHHATILSYTDSLAQAYAQTGSLPFSAVSGYTYTFDADGGIINGKSIYKISNKLINDNLLNELVPTDSARKFVGWALENNPEAVLTALPDVQADTHFIAVWNNDSNNVFADALTATAGEQITIPVKIENNAGFMGCNFIIDYNKNNLLPVSVDSGDVLTTGLEDNITGNAVPGQMNVYWAGKQNVYDDGVLFYITFRVKNAATGSDEIAISYSQEDTFDEQFHDVVFDCRNIALTYSNSVLPTLPQLELEADQNAPIYVGEAFAVNIRISNANVITDEQFAFDYDYTKFEIVEFAAAEGVQAQVDNDVLQLTALPAGATQIGQIVFRPLTSAATGENSIAIQGNEGESILGGNFTFTVSETVASKQITVSGSTAAFDKDGNFKVKVNFANNGGIMGYKLKFYYDAAVIKPVSAAKGDNFRSGDLTTNIGSKEGEFVVVWHDAQNAFGDGEAFTIDFKRITDDPVETAITASYSPKDTFNENWEDVELVTEDIPVSIQEVSPLINIYGADDAGNLSATAGETVTVPIYIKDNPGLMGTKLVFDYNAENLTPVSVTAGDVFSGGLQDNIDGDAVPGRFNVYWAGSQNNYENGILFYITLRVNANALGEDEIGISYSQEDTFDENWNDVVLKCQKIAVQYQNSSVEYSPMLQLTLADNAPIYASDSFAVNLTLKNAPQSINTAFALNYDAARFEVEEFTAADGINAGLENDTLSVAATGLSGDVSLGTIVFKAKGVYESTGDEISLANASDGSILGNKIVLDVLAAQIQPTITVSGTADDLDADDNFKVHLNFADNAGIMGYKLRIGYDASLIQPIAAENGAMFSSGTLTDNIGITPGEFVVVWQATEDVKGDGEALTLTFKALRVENISTALSVSYSAADTFNENWEEVELLTEDIPVTIHEPAPQINIYGADDAGNLSATAGETVTVPIYIKDNPGLMGTKLVFDYNAENLTPVSVTAGDVFSGGLQDNIDGDAVPGRFNVYWAGSQNNYENGILFYITLRVNANALGEDEIGISYSQEDTFDENWNDVVLKCQKIAVQYQSSFKAILRLTLADNAPIYAADNFAVNLTLKNAPQSINTAFDLHYDAARFEVVEFSAADGINAGLENDTLGVAANDLSGDVSLGTLVLKAKGIYGSTGNEISLANASDGSVLGNKIVLDVLAAQIQPTITVSGTADDLDADDNFKVHLNFADNAGIMGYKLRIGYDASLIQPIAAENGAMFSSGTLTDNIGTTPGEFVVVWQATGDVSGDGEALTLSFKALKVENSTTALTISYSAADTFNENYDDVILNCSDVSISLICNYHQFAVKSQVLPNCLNGGRTVYYCTRCAYEYTEEVPALGHTPITLEAVAPTCTQPGLTEGSKCSVCGEILTAQQEVPALGHLYSEEITKAATCEEDGSKTFTCSRCHHSYSEVIPATGHNWGEWTVVLEPTCAVEGLKIRACNNNASHIERASIEKLAHTPITLEAVAPTCTQPGLTEGSKCSVCGEILTAQQEVPALGHLYSEEITKAATCEEDGSKTFTCSRCHHSYSEVIPATGHNWGEWTVVLEPTCAVEGLKIKVCHNNASHIERASIEKLAHTPITLEAVAPTCTQPGLTEGSKCSVCGEILTPQQEIPALGHQFTKKVMNEQTLRTPKTAETPATYFYTCERCGAIDHDFTHYFTDDSLICVTLQLETVIGRQAELTLSKDGKQVAVDSNNGAFAFEDLEPGQYKVFANADKGVRVYVQEILLSAEDYGKVIDLQKVAVPLGNVNGDAAIDVTDIALLLSDTVYAQRNTQYDLNGDGVIDFADISVILSSANYAKSDVAMD